jgi:hypothetical protein
MSEWAGLISGDEFGVMEVVVDACEQERVWVRWDVWGSAE